MTSALRRALIFAGGLAAGILRPGRLSYLVLFVTGDCNARCPDCFNVLLPHLSKEDPPARGPALTLEEYGAIAARLSPLFQVVLSGGEPFLREDLDAIVGLFYERAGARLFSIPTNGSLPDRVVRKLDRMAALCPDATFNLIVSLDARGRKHDELRRLPGGFDKAVSLCGDILGLKARRGNINLVVSTVVSERNLDDVPELIRFLRDVLPAAGWHHNIQYDQRSGSRLPHDPSLRRKVREIERLASSGQGGGLWSRLIARWYVRWINALILSQLARERMLYRCAGGRKLAVIMSDGVTSPCEPFVFEDRYRALPRFDIRRYRCDYGELRRDPEYARLLRFIEEGKCAACAWRCAATASMGYGVGNWPLAFTAAASPGRGR